MKLFSQRYGYKPVKNVIQIDTMDQDLRNGLWNALDIFYWSEARPDEPLNDPYNREQKGLFTLLWLNYFKQPIDTIPDQWDRAHKIIRDYFFSCQWAEVYDIIEFIANNYNNNSLNERFMNYCNSILERELSGYRFIGEKITPITAEEEIAEIEKALESTDSLRPVIIHLKEALKLFSDRKSPDYRNSIKESVSAVEAICNLITGSNNATLGDALKIIKDKIEIHTSLRQSFIKLYGYTSDAEGIRHALLDEPNLDFEDAKFMLVSCSAFINYLKVKSSKAGIEL